MEIGLEDISRQRGDSQLLVEVRLQAVELSTLDNHECYLKC